MLSRRYLQWFCFALGLWSAHSAQAGRNDGINVSYDCLGGNSYRITVNLYRDCAEFTDTPDFIPVHVSSSCATLGFVYLPFQYGQEVSQLCPDMMANSSCNGGSLPGVDLSVFQGVVELEPCSDWKFIVAEQNRAAVENLYDPGLDSRIHIETLLDNADGSCNSSPTLNLLNLPFICEDQPFYYNLDFQEPDGDSLVYALVPAVTSGMDGVPYDMSYEPGYSGAYPIEGISINPHTGQIHIEPNISGKFTVVIRVREYRNGNLVGEVRHDFNVFVNPCTTPPPAPVAGSLTHVSGGGYPLADDVIGICPGDDFCFEIAFSSADPQVALSLSSDITQIIPDAVETISGTNPATIRFCGTAPVDVQNQSFVISVVDDVCEISGLAYYAISFEERQPLEASADVVSCAGSPVQLSSANDTAYTWYDLAGNPLAVPDEISCNPCQQPIVAPDTTTTYVVQGAYGESSCAAVDTVTVVVPLAVEVNAGPETCYRNDGTIELTVINGSGNYTYVWDDIGTATASRDHLSEGSYTVTVEDNVHGCSKTITVELDGMPFPLANAGETSSSCGLDVVLNAVPSFGQPTWSSPNGVVFDDPSAFDATATVEDEGIYTLIWTEDDGDGCVNSDTLEVAFYHLPQSEIVASDTVCGPSLQVSATALHGIHSWNSSAGLTLDDIGLNPLATASVFGDHRLVLEVVNGPCAASDTLDIHFIPQPVAFAGTDAEVCGTSATLQPTPSVGTGQWIMPEGFTCGPQGDDGEIEVVAGTYGMHDFIWEETAEGHCLSRDTVKVRFTEMPDLYLPSDTVLCGDTLWVNPGYEAVTMTWDIDPGFTIDHWGDGLISVTGPTGTAELSLTADNGFGCSVEAAMNISLFDPMVTYIVAPDTVCGLSAEVSAGGEADAYSWVCTEGFFDNPDSPSTTMSVPTGGTYNMSVSAEYGVGCVTTVSATVTFVEMPTPHAGSDTAVCGLTFQPNATASVGLFAWNLNPPVHTNSPSEPSAVISADTYGLFPLVAVESNLGCTATDTAWVRFDEAPLIENPQWICTDRDGEFTVDFEISGGDPSTWTVQGLDGTLEDDYFQSHPLLSESPVQLWFGNGGVCPADTLTGTAFCEVITFGGVMAHDTLRVCGLDTAFAQVSVPPVLDANDSLRYILHDGVSGSPGEILAWNDEPRFTMPESALYGQVYHISAVAGNYGEDGIDMDHPQVSISQSQPVIFHAIPEVFIDFDYTICPGDTAEVHVDMSGDFPQTFTYSMGGEYHTIPYGMSSVQILISDSGAFIPISTQSEYCEGLVWGSGNIDFRSLPQMEAEVDPFVCGEQTALLELDVTGYGAVSFAIVKDGQDFGEYSVTGDTAIAVVAPGSYDIHEIADEYCTSDTAISFTLDAYDIPAVDAGEDLVACTGDTLLLGMMPEPGVSYSWSGSQGALNPAASQTAFTMLNPGYYPQTAVLILEASTAHCSDRDTVRVEVYPIPQLQVIAPEQSCEGEFVTMIGYGAETYEWLPHHVFDDPFSTTPYTLATVSGEYMLIGTNTAGCSDTLSGYLEVFGKPSSEFSISSLEGCAPLDVSLHVDQPYPGATYHWFTGRNDREGQEHVVFETYPESGVYTVSLTATSPQGCTSQSVAEEPLAVYAVTSRFEVSPTKPSSTNSTVFFNSTSTGGEEWRWTIDSALVSTERNFRYRFPEEEGGEYEVCLVTLGGSGCVDTACRIITVDGQPHFFVPNAFTPDGDGLNDLFYPQMVYVDVRNYRFWIVDREGNVVFETNDVDGKWNGSQGRSEYFAPPGVYVWHIVADIPESTERVYRTGRVTLIR